MSLLLIGLSIGYCILSFRPQYEAILYGLLVLHVVTLGWMLSGMQWSEPMLGLTLISWLLSVVAVLIVKQPKTKTLVPPVLGSIAVLLMLAMLAPIPSNPPIEVEMWVALHVMLILIGYVGCIAAGLLGAVYIFVQHKLKEKSLQTVVRYPSLHRLDELITVGVWIGVSGLFTGSSAGVLWGLSQERLSLDITTMGSFALLLWYGSASFGRVFGRSSRWTAWMSLSGVGVVAVYFFLSAVIGSWHVGGGA